MGGDKVSIADGSVYTCKPGPTVPWCAIAAYAPGTTVGNSAWTLETAGTPAASSAKTETVTKSAGFSGPLEVKLSPMPTKRPASLYVKGWSDPSGGILEHGAVLVPNNLQDKELADSRVKATFVYAGSGGNGDAGSPYFFPGLWGATMYPYTTIGMINMARRAEAMRPDGKTIMPTLVVYTAELSGGGDGTQDLLDIPTHGNPQAEFLREHFFNLIVEAATLLASADSKHPYPGTIIMNPDMLGAMQQNNVINLAYRNPDGSFVKVPVRAKLQAAIDKLYDFWSTADAATKKSFPMSLPSAKPAIPSDIEDNLLGWFQASNWVIKAFGADKIPFGWQINLWAQGTSAWIHGQGGNKNMPHTPDTLWKEAGQPVSAFLDYVKVFQGKYKPDFVVFDRYELDDFNPNARNANYAYDSQDWDNFVTFVSQISSHLSLPALLWQIPASHLVAEGAPVKKYDAAKHFGAGGTYFMGDATFAGTGTSKISQLIKSMPLPNAGQAAVWYGNAKTIGEYLDKYPKYDWSTNNLQKLINANVFGVLWGGGNTTGVFETSSSGHDDGWMFNKVVQYYNSPLPLVAKALPATPSSAALSTTATASTTTATTTAPMPSTPISTTTTTSTPAGGVSSGISTTSTTSSTGSSSSASTYPVAAYKPQITFAPAPTGYPTNEQFAAAETAAARGVGPGGAQQLELIRSALRVLDDALVDKVAPGNSANPDNVKRVERVLGEKLYEQLFPVREIAYSYANLLKAVAKFPVYCMTYKDGRDSDMICRRLLATSFAHFVQETGGNTASLTPDQVKQGGFLARHGNSGLAAIAPAQSIATWNQGLWYLREMGFTETTPNGYGECVFRGQGTSLAPIYYPCAQFSPGNYKSYFGRGAKQLSYNYNYGPFSTSLYGNPHVLLDKPELVADTWLNLASAVWFAVFPQSPKPPMTWVVDGTWVPNAVDTANNMKPGFGATIQIINGGVECGSQAAQEVQQVRNRIAAYREFTKALNVPIESEDALGCAKSKGFQPGSAVETKTYLDRSWSAPFACQTVGYWTPFSLAVPGDYKACVDFYFRAKVTINGSTVIDNTKQQ